MTISYQSAEGHTVLNDLSDAEVAARFDELTRSGYRAFADTKIDDPVGPIKTLTDVPPDTQELYFIAPLVGG